MTFGLSAAAIGGIAAGVGAIGGAIISSNGAQDAANIQAGATQAGIGEQARQFDKVQQLLAPYMSAGSAGLQAYRDLIGLGGTPATTVETEEQIRARLAPQFAQQQPGQGQAIPWRPRSTQTQSYDPYRDYLARGEGYLPPEQFYAMTGLPRPDQLGTSGGTAGQNPDLDAAVQAELARQQAAAGPGVSAQQAQQNAINGIIAGPQFGSLSQQGQEAVLAAASATGGLRGGNTQNSLARFRSDLLSSLIDKQLARYGSLAQTGQNSAAGVGTAALSTGQGVAGLLQQGGAAQAGGILAGSNALASAVGNIGGLLATRIGGGAQSTPAMAGSPGGYQWGALF